MKESLLNTIIKNNIMNSIWCHKLPDPSKADVLTTNKRPFDGFGITEKSILYYETKIIKDYQSFNFKRIRSHQLENLLAISKGKKFHNNIDSLIMVGVYLYRKGVDLFIFDIDFINKLIEEGKKSLLKKELLKYKEDDKYIEIRKKTFDANLIKDKIIYG